MFTVFRNFVTVLVSVLSTACFLNKHKRFRVNTLYTLHVPVSFPSFNTIHDSIICDTDKPCTNEYRLIARGIFRSFPDANKEVINETYLFE